MLAWLWLLERTLGGLALLQFARLGGAAGESADVPLWPWLLAGLAGTALVLAFGDHHYPLLEDIALARPWELVPGALFGMALLWLLSTASRNPDRFDRTLLIALVILCWLQLGVAPFSLDLLDAFSRDALVLRLLAQLLLFLALCQWLTGHLRDPRQTAATATPAQTPPAPSPALILSENHQAVSRKVLLSLMEDFHRAREQEAEAKQFAESIIENMPLMVFVKDAQHLQFQRLNRAGEQLLGYPNEFFLGKNDYDFFPAEQADFFTRTDQAVLRGDGVVDIPEEPVNTPNGVRWLHTRKIPIKNAKGVPQYLLGISEDITEKRELEQRFTLLFDIAPSGLMLVRQDNSIVLVNQACCRIFGYRNDELAGQSMGKLLPETVREQHVHFMQQFWADPQPRKMSSRPNLVGIHRDGHQVPLDIALQPLPHRGELFVLAAITDITERQRFIEQLEQTNRYKTQFLANMSHELRTPMNSIIGFTDKVLQHAGDTLNERHRDAMQTVLRNAHHLLALINDVLDLAKIEAGKMEVEYEEFELRLPLELLRAEYTQLARMKGLQFNLQLPDATITLITDRRKLLQICHNLVSNAIKYTEQGTVTLNVSQEIHTELGPCVRLAFADTGIGISTDDQKKLFTEFSRAAEVRQKNIQGTGLGLLITAQLVALLGGRIQAESVHGNGSVFTVLLPLKKK
jgi:PAS domain S-box-containing protein